MYLWKYWLDTKVKFFAAAAFFCFWLITAHIFFVHLTLTSNHHASAENIPDAFFGILVAVSTYCLFVSWVLGNESVGADIGKGSGEYLLTRPGERGHLVWTGWLVGLTEAIVLWIFLAAIMLVSLSVWIRETGSGTGLDAAIGWSNLSFYLPVLLLMFAINAGLLFGLTYCIGVVTRSGSRALLMSAAAIFAYEIVKGYMFQLFHASLPELLLAYNYSDHVFHVPALRSFIARAVCVFCFPALAHFVLQRMEI